MTNIVFKEKQNVATEVTSVENGFTVQVHTKDAGASDIYTHLYSNSFTEVEQDLLQRGVKAALAGSYNGVTAQQVVLEQANKVFGNLAEGKVTCRVARVAKDKPVAKLSYLLQAVLATYAEVTQAMWNEFTPEERKEYVTPEVLQLREDLGVVAKAEASKARLEARQQAVAGQEQVG